MKTFFSILLGLGVLIGFSSCERDFLQMPTTTGSTTIDSVFSTAIKARGAWSNAYFRCLSQGLPYRNDWNSMIQEGVSGTLTYGHPWTMSRDIIINGMNATAVNEDIEGYNANFTYIRQAYLVIENIGKVSDMTDSEKAVVKAEMRALIAYRYTQMLIMYGGVPIISSSLDPDGDLALPRRPAQEVLDSVVTWCDQAAAVLPSVWEDTWKGRMTKSATLAIKAKALLYAARPLFNSATPYLNSEGNNNLICFGSADANRWNTAAAAAEAVITEAQTNGGAYIINTGNPLDDYGTATSTPGNPEVLLAFKLANTNGDNGDWNTYPMTAWYYPRINGTNVAAAAFTCTYSHLINYYKQDGTDQTWPAQDVTTAFSDYTAKMNQMEARFKADFKPYQMAAWNNPGDNNWNATSVGVGYSNGAGTSVKFYYKAGTRRWFEFPIFRLASAYLSAAEAYNETGQTGLALERLNKIHQRAGLPAVTETNKDRLRAIIQREWDIEMFDENYRLHDIKHWKLPEIGNGIIGGAIKGFGYNNNGTVSQTTNTNYNIRVIYQGFWSPKQFLNPFPQTEINKGYLVQNPGY